MKGPSRHFPDCRAVEGKVVDFYELLNVRLLLSCSILETY